MLAQSSSSPTTAHPPKLPLTAWLPPTLPSHLLLPLPPLQDLKAGLLEHAKTLSECKRYDSLLEYLLFALGVVDCMPHWQDDSHNKASRGRTCAAGREAHACMPR